MSKVTITKTYECVTFDELNEDLQQYVLEKHECYLLGYNWFDEVYEWFIDNCREVYGIEVDPKGITFRGFYSQSNGATFTGSVTDIDKFLDNVQPTQAVPNPSIYRSVIQHMFNEHALCLTTKSIGFYNASQANYIERSTVNPHLDMDKEQSKHYQHAEAALDWLEGVWDDICIVLASDLYRHLEEQHEFLTSVEAITDAFYANENVFDKDTGEIFYR